MEPHPRRRHLPMKTHCRPRSRSFRLPRSPTPGRSALERVGGRLRLDAAAGRHHRRVHRSAFAGGRGVARAGRAAARDSSTKRRARAHREASRRRAGRANGRTLGALLPGQRYVSTHSNRPFSRIVCPSLSALAQARKSYSWIHGESPRRCNRRAVASKAFTDGKDLKCSCGSLSSPQRQQSAARRRPSASFHAPAARHPGA